MTLPLLRVNTLSVSVALKCGGKVMKTWTVLKTSLMDQQRLDMCNSYVVLGHLNSSRLRSKDKVQCNSFDKS